VIVRGAVALPDARGPCPVRRGARRGDRRLQVRSPASERLSCPHDREAPAASSAGPVVGGRRASPTDAPPGDGARRNPDRDHRVQCSSACFRASSTTTRSGRPRQPDGCPARRPRRGHGDRVRRERRPVPGARGRAVLAARRGFRTSRPEPW
jgi:hypothetical protein